MAAKSLSLQDHFLNSVRRAKLPVTIFLVKGVKLQGVITWFDAFSLLLSAVDDPFLPPEVLDNQSAMSGANTGMAIMGSPLREAREAFEREYLKIQIRRFSGNISRTASFIGMERSALHRKLKALGIGDKREGEE